MQKQVIHRIREKQLEVRGERKWENEQTRQRQRDCQMKAKYVFGVPSPEPWECPHSRVGTLAAAPRFPVC